IWDIPIRCLSTRWGDHLRARFIRRLMRQVYRFADHFIISIAPDQQLAWYRIPVEKVSAFGNAIWRDHAVSNGDGDDVALASREVLCSRGSHLHDMGLDTLAAAFPLVLRRFPDTRLTIIGRIPEDVRPQVASLTNVPNVQILNRLQHADL